MATKQKANFYDSNKPRRKDNQQNKYKTISDDQKEVNFPRIVARIWGLISAVSFVSNGWYLLTESDRESKKCVIAGALMIIIGLVIIFMECICCLLLGKNGCCDKLDNGFPFWVQGLMYMISTVPVLVLCFGLKTLVSSIMVIFLGVIYVFLTCIVKSKKYERLRVLAEQRFRDQQRVANMPYETIRHLYRHN